VQYRPFPSLDMAISALTLSLMDPRERWRADEVRDLIHAAFENGVNSVEMVSPNPAMLVGVAEGIAIVDRPLICVGLRLQPHETANFQPQGVVNQVRAAIVQTGLKYLDVVTIHSPMAPIPKPSLEILWKLKKAGHVRALGITADTHSVDRYVETALFQSLVTPFNLFVDSTIRNRIRHAFEKDIAVLASDPYSADIMRTTASSNNNKGGLFKRKVEVWQPRGPFDFLHDTPGWTAEELCVGHNLTEPCIASIVIQAERRDMIDRLSNCIDRHLPQGVGAQVEMARFAANQTGERRRA
jgi:hypothetical protein